MTILCLCREQHPWKLIPGYADAFRRRGIKFFCVDDSIPFDAPLEDPSLKWFRWSDDRAAYVSFTPPAIGETVVIR